MPKLPFLTVLNESSAVLAYIYSLFYRLSRCEVSDKSYPLVWIQWIHYLAACHIPIYYTLSSPILRY